MAFWIATSGGAYQTGKNPCVPIVGDIMGGYDHGSSIAGCITVTAASAAAQES
jgi:hypothetical protein